MNLGYVVVVSEGVFNVSNGSCSHSIGVLSPEDVLNAEILPSGSYHRSNEIYGGKFEGLKAFLRGAHKFVKDNKLLSKGLAMIPNQYAQMGSKGAEAMGYGMSGGGALLDYGGSLTIPKQIKTDKKTVKLSDFV